MDFYVKGSQSHGLIKMHIGIVNGLTLKPLNMAKNTIHPPNENKHVHAKGE